MSNTTDLVFLSDTCRLKFDHNRIFLHTSVNSIVDIKIYASDLPLKINVNDFLVNVVSYNANRATFTEAL